MSLALLRVHTLPEPGSLLTLLAHGPPLVVGAAFLIGSIETKSVFGKVFTQELAV